MLMTFVMAIIMVLAGLGNVAENKVLDQLLDGADYAIAGVTVALVSVAVTETDTSATITRVSYTGYADRAIVHADDFNAASGGTKTNKAVIAFPQNTGATTATALGFAIINNNGDIILFGTLPSTSIAPNITPEWAIGALTITAD